MQAYHVAITIDDNYVQHACVMLKSLQAHLDSPAKIYCLFDNLNSKNQVTLTQTFQNSPLEIELIKFDDSLLPNLPIKENDHVSSAAFFRIWLPDILKELKQVVFLDTDIIVNGNISELFCLKLDNYAIAAVEDLGMDARKKAALGMEAGAAYFNSGVMVMNLDYFRKHQLTQKLSQFLTSHPELCEFWDQDAFNAVINGCFYKLPLAFNVQTGFYTLSGTPQLVDALGNPLIVHYTGGGNCKPWFYHNTHPLKGLYFKYLKKTPFKYYYPPDLPRSWFIFRKLKFMLFK